jgi:hypothetical protein
MLLLVAALVIQLPALPEADPFAADTLPAWARAARAVLRNEAKVEYVEFLKETYGYNIDRLNAAYGLEASSFTDLYSFDYRALDGTRDAVRRDDAAFRRALNEMLVAEAAKITGRRIRLTEEHDHQNGRRMAAAADAAAVRSDARQGHRAGLYRRIQRP